MPELKPEVTYEDFQKLDLRVATIKEVEAIPKADRLWKLTLDVGELGERVICAGIKEQYPDPESLQGQQIVIVANLAPRPLRGVLSHGMLLAASNTDHSNVEVLQIQNLHCGLGSKPEHCINAGDTVG